MGAPVDDSIGLAQEVFSELETLLKLILNLASGENSNVHYFLELALKELLEQVLKWNSLDESIPSFSYRIELDTLIGKIFENLINSDEAFENGNRLARQEDLWIVNRFAPRMMHKQSEVRREAISLMIALVRKLSGDPKEFMIERLDLIRRALYVITYETTPSHATQCLVLLECCLHYDASTFATH